MSFKGPLRDPNSRRGMQENAGSGEVVSERPAAPAWLKKKAVLALFNQLVDDAVASGVPTRACDAHSFAMAAQATLDYQQAKDAASRARIGRDLARHYDDIGASPKARLRMGIKGKAKPGQTATGRLLAMVGAVKPKPDEAQAV
jgi:hypothetical protein